MRHQTDPIGVVLAGGAGRRLGGNKALARLCERPLISYPLAALREALSEVVVLAKADTELPDLGEVTVWIEPDEPRHPLAGLRHALTLARPRPVFVCAGDLPFVSARLVAEICRADPGMRPAVLAARCGRAQPLLGLYQPGAAPLLSGATRPEGPLMASIAALGPALVEIGDELELFNVNTPEDLSRAAAALSGRRPQPKVKS